MTIHPDLADRAVCASVDGELRDLRDALAEDCQLTLHTDATPEGTRVAGHTAAHIVAQAVKRLFPSAILGLDPIANGRFSCDVEFGRSLTVVDLRKIQEEVDQIVAEDLPIERETLSKGDFVDKVAEDAQLSRKQATAAVDAMLGAIEDALKEGKAVSFTGFGKFHVAERGAREGRNPRTGESMTIAAAKVPRVTAGSALKKAIK